MHTGPSGRRVPARTRVRALSTLAVVLAATLGLLLTPGPALGSAAAPAGAGTLVAAVPTDTTSRVAVRDAYRADVPSALSVPIGWTGSVSGCVPGQPSSAAQAATAKVINWSRSMTGLDTLTLDPALASSSQQAALMMQAKGALSHEPTPDWPCYTSAGDTAAGRSNLCLGCSGAKAVWLYLSDNGVESLGHRRWVLYPKMLTMGSGSTSGANALQWGRMDGAGRLPAWTSWPPAGFFPQQAEPGGWWSLSGGTAAWSGPDFSAARVSVRSGTTSYPVTLLPVSNGYGLNTLGWRFSPGDSAGMADKAYDVTVSNIKVGATVTTYRYTVTLFDAVTDIVFVDVPRTAPLAADIYWLAEAGISTGWVTPDGREYRPAEPVTRESMAAFLYRLRSRPVFVAPATSPFTDVPTSHQFYKEITWLASKGVTTGWPDRTFRPSLEVSRESMAAFLYRLAGKPAYTPPTTSPFADVPTSHQFYKEIAWLSATGISTGWTEPDSTRTFRPSLPVARDAMAAFLHRFDTKGY